MISYSPTKVNPETAKSPYYEYLSPQKLLLPNGEYILKHFLLLSGNSPIFYLFNSDDKFTGYWMYLEIFDKNNQQISIDFTKQYPLKSLNGKESVPTKKGQTSVVSRFHQLTSIWSSKYSESASVERYPTYQSPDQPIAKSSGTIVDQDSNQPVKGAIVEKTD